MTDARIEIHLPECSEDAISSGLRAITQRLQEVTGEGPYGVLGGDNGYGVAYENEVFQMHPFCWCERADCPWCVGCECEVERQGGDWVTTKECKNCTEGNDLRAPNFRYKPTGATVHWYKYIGRSMEVEGTLPLDFHIQCIKSVIADV